MTGIWVMLGVMPIDWWLEGMVWGTLACCSTKNTLAVSRSDMCQRLRDSNVLMMNQRFLQLFKVLPLRAVNITSLSYTMEQTHSIYNNHARHTCIDLTACLMFALAVSFPSLSSLIDMIVPINCRAWSATMHLTSPWLWDMDVSPNRIDIWC